MKKDITLYYNAVCKEHSYDNGFCTKCGGYQPADYNESTGSYEIGNGGQMFWFAALVNGDGEHTQIQEAKPDAHGVLVSDISLKNPADENYEWKPIGEFKGIFDGQNHTISDFSMTKVNDQSIGFFQNLMSDPNETDEAKKATLKNFTLNGTIVTTAEAASAVGGVVGTTSDSVIRRVNSNVNIGSGLIYYIGGIVGEINAATSIEESTYSGKIVLDYSFYGVGGIVGFVTDDDTYAGSTKIKDCANYGLITYYKVENHGGRGYSGGITGQVALGEEDFILSDCYNYGSVLAEEWKEIYGAISGYCAAKKDGIKNNYYLDTLPVKGFLGEAEIANDEELAKAKTAEQFKSGEEAYLLNNEVTDGSQVWYQNIDNGETPDAYPVLDTVIMGNERLYQIMKEKEAIYAKEDFTDEDGIRASELEGEFAEMNGWEAESDAATLLNGLGVDTEFHYTQMADLTGSMKVKVLLAQALFGNPDILLLDEPTNHLDLPAIEWLEEFLINFDNTVIVVSHDRYFLNKVCTHTADIDYGKIQLYAGNYDFWFESSQLLIKQMKEANKKKEEKIKELQEFISRFSANASKSKQATSRKRALEKIQLDDMRPSSRKYPYIDFRPNREIGNEVLMVENLSKTIDGVKVLDNISFTLGREDKVAFVGANEQAITTFFKILTGEMEPDEGNYKWGVTTSQAYFPKDNTQEFDNDLTITDWLTQYSEIKDATYVRGFLGRMLFPGEDGVKRVRVLSGGEKVRCLLSKMMISGANILILDEPTNHLDMESITALNNGLIKFPGVILFTSHDHQFVQTTANRIMEILPNGKLVDKITTYDEYLASDEMAKKRHVFQVNEEDAQDN